MKKFLLSTLLAFSLVSAPAVSSDFFIAGVPQGSALLLDGSLPMAADLQMGSNNITGLADPVNPQDGSTKNYADTKDVEALDEGGSLSGVATSFDFVGAGVVATNSAGAITVTIAGGGGSGDVVGPGSSVDGHVAVFSGITGKLLKDGGAVNIDGAVFAGTTSSTTNTLIIGTVPPGLVANRMTFYGMNNGAAIVGTGFSQVQLFGTDLIPIVVDPKNSIVIGHFIGQNLTFLQDSQIFGGDSANNIQSLDSSFIAGKNGGKAASLGGTSWNNVILIGEDVGSGINYGTAQDLIAFGRNGRFSNTSSPQGEVIFGSNSFPYQDFYFGEGGASSAPDTDVTLQPTGARPGLDTDLAATGDMIIAGARGSGTGTGSRILFKTAPAGSTGSSVNALVTRMEIFVDGGIDFDGAVFTGTTSGTTNTMIFGTPIPGMVTNRMTFYGMGNGGGIVGTGFSNVQLFGSDLIPIVVDPKNSLVIGHDTGLHLTFLQDSQLLGNGIGNNVQSINFSFIAGKKAAQAASLGGTSWNNVILIGEEVGGGINYGTAQDLIAFGRNGRFSNTASPQGEVIFGSNGQPYLNFYFGEGGRSTAPDTDVTLQPTGARGGLDTDTDATGDIIIAGAKGTGTGANSDVLLRTAVSGSTGTALNTLITRVKIKSGVDAAILITDAYIAEEEQLVALTADNQSVTATRNVMRVTSDNATSTLRTMDLQNGTSDGQSVHIISDTPTNAWELLNTGNKCGVVSTFTSTDNASLFLRWNAATACWHEPR